MTGNSETGPQAVLAASSSVAVSATCHGHRHLRERIERKKDLFWLMVRQSIVVAGVHAEGSGHFVGAKKPEPE